MRYPTFQHERELEQRHGHYVIGVDEAGCGCLAGPVIAAAIHLPVDSRIAGIADSKLLTPEKREALFALFIEKDFTFSIGIATAAEVDRYNVRQATYLAMKRAIDLFRDATFALIDAWHVPDITIPQRGIIHGDRLVKSIAAASIVAKVVRDRLMREYDEEYPGYALGIHKGYGTEKHREALKKRGPSPLHRRTFLKKMGLRSMLKE